jgi:hypothetical protein
MADWFRNSRSTYLLRQQLDNDAHYRHWIKNPLQVGFLDSKKPDNMNSCTEMYILVFQVWIQTLAELYDSNNDLRLRKSHVQSTTM